MSNHPNRSKPSRPIAHLREAGKSFPDAWKRVDEFRASRGGDLPEWPDWCFLPMSGFYAIVSEKYKVNMLTPELSIYVSVLAAIGTWRYSQGIYQIDPDLRPALADSIVSGSLPSEIFYRLPEWCVYIETPGYEWLGQPLHGFWAHLEWDVNTSRTELRFLMDCDKDLVGMILHLGPWTITEAVDRAAAESQKQAERIGRTLPTMSNLVQQIAAEINPLISILLYLCSQEPEIDCNREPGSYPSHPRPKKTKKGWRLFPPDQPKIWTVGANIGAQLRQSFADSDPTGRTVRAHLRRGHWHGYWTGPRDGDREFTYKWISPLVVGGE